MICSLIELTMFLAHDQVPFHVQTIGLNLRGLTTFCVNQGKRMLRELAVTAVGSGYFRKNIKFLVKLPANSAGRQYLPTFANYLQPGWR